MKKIINYTFFIIFLVILILITILSTVGIETDKFNKLIGNKINQSNNYTNIDLKTVRFKFDIKEISLFLETIDPVISYREAKIPANNIKVYVDFFSIIKNDPKIEKINLSLNQLNINELKKLSIVIKPSNLKSFINNKIKEGKLNVALEIYLGRNNLVDNFIARGSVVDLKAEIIKKLNLERTNFTFFADKTDVLIKNIKSQFGPIKIEEGDLKLNLLSGIKIESDLKTEINYDLNYYKYLNFISNQKFAKSIINLKGTAKNNLLIKLDKTFKVSKFDYKSEGLIYNADFNLDKIPENNFLIKNFKKISIKDTDINAQFSSQKNFLSLSGNYLLDENILLPFSLENEINENKIITKIDADINENIEIETINYAKPKGEVANISINLEKTNDQLKIKNINFIENQNRVLIENIKFRNKKFESLKRISIKTFIKGKKNNDFSILFGKKILVKGDHFDATNLPKIFNTRGKENILSKITKPIEIDFINMNAPLSEKLKNFKLLGNIEKGKFTKIIAKGDFGNNNYLDIKLKKDIQGRKYLEIYSDLPKPLLTEFSFFKGLSGGKLLYSSTIEENTSKSLLKIEKFKVVNAPGMVKLLSLADLGGLADLAEGEGISFDILEINMEQKDNFLNLNEILALGPSISILIEGYKDENNLTSLRGTLVPAKTLNKMISKIPVLGDIVIPKEVGEGLFGISFKMKGPPGKIKTTINPIRTLTPRFIQKIVDRNKKSK